ncbi:hypothetical protein GCK32_014761 [Trichostrongylus colubriformis]|uniref:Uncharacterized protein n=1 Tax=Trichostrongylus colubriformis TaxID=6319 RepID=A0AAN8EWR5_TRICO
MPSSKSPVLCSSASDTSLKPRKMKKADFALPTQGASKKEFKKMRRLFNKELETVKNLVIMHIDEVNEELSALRREIKQMNLPVVVSDIKAFTQRMILLECEMKKAFEGMDVPRRFERVDRKLGALSDDLRSLKSAKESEREQRPAREASKSEQPKSGGTPSWEDVLLIDESIGDEEEQPPSKGDPRKEAEEKRPAKRESKRAEDDVRKTQEEIAAYSKKLTKTKHEIFSVGYRIEQAWKKMNDCPKEAKRQIEQLKEEKYRLRQEESNLVKKIDKGKERLRGYWEREHRPGPSRSRGGV